MDIDFFTHCSNSAYIDYSFRFEDTKIYLKNCLNSSYFFGIDTYLYQNSCIEICTSPIALDDNNRYSLVDIRECFDTKQECINKGYKIFKFLCVSDCPENSIETEHNNRECLYKYYENNTNLICGQESDSCEDIGYPITSDYNKCFLSRDDCIERGHKFFNNICYINNCPENTEEKNNDGICNCSYRYIYVSNSDSYICFEENETCESKSYYPIIDSINSMQCFKSLEDCKLNELKIFNNECYITCPTNTITDEHETSKCKCGNYYFYSKESGIYDCFDSDKFCITANEEYKFTNNETKECYKN